MSIDRAKEENSTILNFVEKHGKQWTLLPDTLPEKTSPQIANHDEKDLNPTIIKGPFSPKEDQAIIEFVRQNGAQNWINITPLLPRRTPKQCRERWWNHLNPNINTQAWLQTEDALIFHYVSLIGKKWSIISRFIPGRTDNAIKNRYHYSISKRIIINPMTGCKELIPSIKKWGKPPNKARFTNPYAVTNVLSCTKTPTSGPIFSSSNNTSKKTAAKPVNINPQRSLFFDFDSSDPISEPDLTSKEKLKTTKINETQKDETVPATGTVSSHFHHVDISVPEDYFQDDDSGLFQFTEIF